MIIAVLNQKGGTGKSLVATNLSALFAKEQSDVLLVDADPDQRSATDWIQNRPEGLPAVSSVILPAGNLKRNSDMLRQKWNVVVIDGGARITEHAHAAISIADWVVVPVKPSRADLDATARFLDVIQTDLSKRDTKRSWLLMNQFQEGTTISQAARDQVKSWGFPVFKAVMRSYVAFAEAFWEGKSVDEYQPNSKAADDIREVFKELKGIIKRG